MPFAEWDEIFETGIEEFDLQHKKMIQILNLIYIYYQRRLDKKMIEEVVQQLTDYFQKHFASEEAMLESIEYPEEELAVHKNAHQEFLKAYLQKVHEGNIMELLKFVKNWWVSHVFNIDKKYGEFIKMKNKS